MGEATDVAVAPSSVPEEVSITSTTPFAAAADVAADVCDEKSPPEKVVEEACPPEEADSEDKLVPCEPVESEDKEVVAAAPVAVPAVPFVEESYHVKDLKESEKKALLELKAKIREALKNNAFLAPPPPVKAPEATPKEVDVADGDKEQKQEVERKLAEEKTSEVVSEEVTAVEVVAESSAEAKEACKEDIDLPEVKEADTCPAPEDKETVVSPLPEECEVTIEDAPKETVSAETVDQTSDTTASREVAVEEDDDSLSLEDLSIWGVPLLHTKGDERTDVILLKFLRARDFKVNDAMSMLKDTVIWRKEFGAEDLLEEELDTEFDSISYMYGADKDGHPVCYNNFGVFQDNELYQKTFCDEAQFKKFLRWRIQLLERGIKKLDFSPGGVHSMVQVIDLKDSPGIFKLRNITKKALTLLQDNYPELVAKQIYINVPWYFGALISLHGKLMTPRSKSKVVVARPGKVSETLFRYIAPEHVALHYGGLSRPDDKEFEGVEAPVNEISLKAGEKQTIELVVDESGSILVWDVSVIGWDVVYGEEFVPSAEGSYTVIIQKSKRVAVTEEPLRNTFKATEAGKVVLTVENTSRRKKLVVYRHIIKKEVCA